jgi:HPt (histidine-containing phosphotransfer) domain-containing protein
MMATQEIDQRTYTELQEMSGMDFVGELVATFLEDAPEQIAELRAAWTRRDAETFRRAAHSLKSNSATFGALRLAALARELEVMGKDNRLEGESGKLNQLEGVYQKVAQELKDLQR